MSDFTPKQQERIVDLMDPQKILDLVNTKDFQEKKNMNDKYSKYIDELEKEFGENLDTLKSKIAKRKEEMSLDESIIEQINNNTQIKEDATNTDQQNKEGNAEQQKNEEESNTEQQKPKFKVEKEVISIEKKKQDAEATYKITKDYLLNERSFIKMLNLNTDDQKELMDLLKSTKENNDDKFMAFKKDPENNTYDFDRETFINLRNKTIYNQTHEYYQNQLNAIDNKEIPFNEMHSNKVGKIRSLLNEMITDNTNNFGKSISLDRLTYQSNKDEYLAKYQEIIEDTQPKLSEVNSSQ